LVQTGQIASQKPLADGAGHTFLLVVAVAIITILPDMALSLPRLAFPE
jgi:hypothetical protein